jgi:hypothetical protein
MDYVVFRFLIVKFNFKTPGREDKQASVANTSASKLPFDVLDAMGGKETCRCISYRGLFIFTTWRFEVEFNN